MDTSDHEITFNKQGFCNHCETYLEEVKTIVPQGSERERRLNNLINQIKITGKNPSVGKFHESLKPEKGTYSNNIYVDNITIQN